MYQAKGGAIYPFTAYQGAEILYIYIILICEALQVGLRLIYDVTTSDRSVPTPKFLKIDPRLRGGIRLRVVPYTHSQLINAQKRFIYMYYGFVKHSKWGLRLNHDVTTSDRSVPTPNFLKIDPMT